MGVHQNWAHGNAFSVAEAPASGLYKVDGVPWTDLVGQHRGWGCFWLGQAGTTNLFHVAIPTPAIIEGARARVNRVFVLFSAGIAGAERAEEAGAAITETTVWDGGNRIGISTTKRWGSHATQIDGVNTLGLSAMPEVFRGLGITVQVEFFNAGEQLIGFYSAGADFEI